MVFTINTFIQNCIGGLLISIMLEKNVIKIGKEEMKLSLFLNHMSIHKENSKEPRDKILVTNLTELLNTQPIYEKNSESYILATNNWD